MNVPAIFQWIQHNNGVFLLFAFLLWKEALKTVRALYNERQKRLMQHSDNSVKISNNQLEERRLAAQNKGGSST